MGRPNQRHPTDPEQEAFSSEVSPEQVIAYLAEQPQPESIREIAHGLGLKHHGRRFLPRIIRKFKKNGDIEEVYGGRYRLAGAKQIQREAQGQATARKSATESASRSSAPNPVSSKAGASNRGPSNFGASKRGHDPNLIAGRIVAHRDGYGFLVPDKPIPKVEGDLFIGRDGLNDAMHGDRVLARIERRRADGRAEGRVVQIVEHEHPTIVGLFRYGPQGNHVLPYDTRILHEVLIPPGDELTPELRQKLGGVTGKDAAPNRRLRLPELDGAVVNVDLTRYPKGGLAPVGRVTEILGRPGEIGVDVEIIIRKHHLPHIFPDEVLAAARATPQKVAQSDLAGRRDFRNLPIVTIDGETARDFDDAVHVAPLPNGHYELQVHIADVAHYIQRGAAIDREAHLRGTSVYFPHRSAELVFRLLSWEPAQFNALRPPPRPPER